MAAYQNYNDSTLKDFNLTDEDISKSLKKLPKNRGEIIEKRINRQ